MDRSLRKSDKNKKAAKRLKEQRRAPKGRTHLNDVVEREVSRLLGERLAPPVAAPTAPAAAMTIVKAPIPPPPAMEQVVIVPPPPVVAPVVAPSAPVDEVVSAAEVFDAGDAVLAHAGKVQPGRRSKRDGAAGDLGAAYTELYAQLCTRMLQQIFRFFQRVYNRTVDVKEFRKQLAGVQHWNQIEINRRAKEIVDTFPDVQAYFKYAYAANVMLMSVVVQRDEDSADLEIEVPKFSVFVHKTYIECARTLYDNPSVLDPSLSDSKRLRVREELFRCFGTAIATALRLMVPLDSIAPPVSKGESFDDVDASDDGDDGDEDDSDEDDSDEDDDEDDDSSDDDSSDDDSSDDDSSDDDSSDDDSSDDDSSDSSDDDSSDDDSSDDDSGDDDNSDDSDDKK